MEYELSEKDTLFLKLKTLEFKINDTQKPIGDEPVEIKTETGKIRGSKRYTLYKKIYYSFERIPYALPPLGDLRFRAPQAMPAWKNVIDCTMYGEKPVQCSITHPNNIEGSEDCLFLNVYTNFLFQPLTGRNRPVMVFIPGGGFQFGEANRELYGPDYFMENDVILITVQYRVAALGFLSLKTPTLATPGNAGLKDIILALQWVKKNAAHFGGNPECITLFGESSGAAAIHILMLSDRARGLFNRAILQSGVATSYWPTCNYSFPYKLAVAAGYQGKENEKDILKYLIGITATEILAAEQKCRQNDAMFSFMPCVEPYLTKHSVFCKPLEKLIPGAWSNNIPIILGANSLEGLILKKTAVKRRTEILRLLESCTDFVPKMEGLKIDSPECREKGLKLREIHVKGDEPCLKDFFEIISYKHYWHPIQKAIDARLRHTGRTTTYLYRFDFISNRLVHPLRLIRSIDSGDECSELDDVETTGAAHADELAYLFTSVLSKPLERQSREYNCIQRMISLWTQFAENGNPNSARFTAKWSPLHPKWSDSLKCWNIDNELNFIDLPEMQKLKVWKSLCDLQPTPATES